MVSRKLRGGRAQESGSEDKGRKRTFRLLDVLGPRAGNYLRTIRGQVAIGFAVVGLVLIAILSLTLSQTRDTSLADVAGRQRMFSQRITKDVLQLRDLDSLESGGQYAPTLAGLKAATSAFESTLLALKSGGDAPLDLAQTQFVALPAAQTPAILSAAEETRGLWDRFRSDVDKAVAAADTASLGIKAVVNNNMQMLALSQGLVDAIKTAGSSEPLNKMLDQAGRQRMLSQRIAKNLIVLARLDGETHASEYEVALGDLRNCVATFEQTLKAFREGGDVPSQVTQETSVSTLAAEDGDVIKAVDAATAEWTGFRSAVESAVAALVLRDEALKGIVEGNLPLLASSNTIVSAVVDKADADAAAVLLFQIMAIVGALIWAVIATLYLGRAEKRMTGKIVSALEDSTKLKDSAEKTNSDLQESILELLNAVADAADGDLSLRAKVQEGALGNVADAFNQMMESFEDLIVDIKNSAVRSADFVQQMEATAALAVESADSQIEALASASAGVGKMKGSVMDVSDRAKSATESANTMKAAAVGGAESIKDAVAGMNALRGNVQAGAKKMKNLGDRSMEINSIVGTIAKISDRTNMLALNAAIEASRAGEHGRGFSVVADEVRRLAERTANATQEIESLVKGIQHETSESVAAMDEQIQAVEEQAKLVLGAGQTLGRIQDQSQDSAGEIDSIAVVAVKEVDSAAAVVQSMESVSEIAKDSQGKAKESLTSSRELAEAAGKMLESVSQFTVTDQ